MRSWWLWLLILGCNKDRKDSDDTDVDTDVDTETDLDTDDTDVGDPCLPDPCASSPGTVCDAGVCVPYAVELARDGEGWTGRVTHVASETRWTFSGQVAGAGATATLAVEGGRPVAVTLHDPSSVDIEVDGMHFGGRGDLGDAAAGLQALLTDPTLVDGLARVPLELACATPAVEPEVLAALLAPWQAVLKYASPDRRTAARAQAAVSGCSWFDLPAEAADRKAPTGLLLFGLQAPIPVVHGFLPFDAAGAMSQETTRAAGDHWGPCGGQCRGTCGIDCPTSNCAKAKVTACEQAATGGNTGIRYDAEQLDCGTATGCVNHDDCYDTCNATWGCGSWDAVTCRHGSGGCDEVACLSWGVTTCTSWAAGLGPYEGRIDYLYPRPGAMGALDEQTCPVPNGALQWQVSPPGSKVADAAAADAYCAGLVLAGHDDWRLPDIGELQQIELGCPISTCDDQYGLPWCGACTAGQGPRADGCYIEPRLDGPCETWWSSTLYSGQPLERRWVWSPLNGAEYVNGASYPEYYARCVRP